MMVVTVKYLAFLMRADNHGEGGIFALLALAPERLRQAPAGKVGVLSLLVIAGACLLFGDGIITPAISVLSALEGLKVATPGLERVVVPATCVILVGLFAIQSRGTGSVGRFFGPVMVVWFLVIGSLGAWHVVRRPDVLAAFNPLHGWNLLTHHGFHGFKLLGSVVLAVTGGEALYADMGHFGRRPIRLAWLSLVFPALVLCYLGQGALLLDDPGAAVQPFFRMVPAGAATFALVALAAPATVIASQALISGVFSLTHQAVRLGYFPRVNVLHTDRSTEGQIYVPLLNWLLAAGSIGLVLMFQSASRLAAAYGIAVTGTMAITSIVFFVVTRHTWGWSAPKAWGLLVLFLSIDLPFLGANVLKFIDGGYIPLVVGSLFLAIMVVWRQGRSLLGEYYRERTVPLETFLEQLPARCSSHRLPGVGVFMASTAQGTPPILDHLVRTLRTAHETIVLFTATTEHSPFVTPAERVTVERLSQGCVRVIARYGFFEKPDVVSALEQAAGQGLRLDPGQMTFFVGRETFVEGPGGKMGPLAERLFAFLTRNARNATLYFGVPAEQVVEVGMRIDL
ncbi:MAG: potassium transporter Kup [Myxococcales bacterium]|nr:MAG: potassium transporter Kup [Myxococcales bacterium]